MPLQDRVFPLSRACQTALVAWNNTSAAYKQSCSFPTQVIFVGFDAEPAKHGFGFIDDSVPQNMYISVKPFSSVAPSTLMSNTGQRIGMLAATHSYQLAWSTMPSPHTSCWQRRSRNRRTHRRGQQYQRKRHCNCRTMHHSGCIHVMSPVPMLSQRQEFAQTFTVPLSQATQLDEQRHNGTVLARYNHQSIQQYTPWLRSLLFMMQRCFLSIQ